MLTAIEYQLIQNQLWQAKQDLYDIVEQIRECLYANKEFKTLVRKKIKTTKQIKLLQYKLDWWQI